MSAAAKPWMKFYPQDWRADEKLRMCSLAARGLWMEMLAIMHRSERYGQLLIGGRVPTDAQLAVQVGASPSEVTALLAELDGADVFSRAASGAIYSRRMTRDAKRAETARKNGKAGGNPSLTKDRGKSASLNRGDKASDKGGVKAQRPEARGQNTPLPPKGDAGSFDLPDWVPHPAWSGFEAMRKQIKKPLTDRGRELAVGKLAELRDSGNDPGAVLDQSTLNSWQGLFPLKGEQHPQRTVESPDFLDHRIAQRRQREEWEQQRAAGSAR